MTTLDDTQQLFFRAITWPRGIEDFLQRGDDHTRVLFRSVFGESPQFLRAERVNIYANAYFHRLLGVLEEIFPRLAFLCEPVGFHNLITDYVLECPSVLPDLRRLGDRLPSFLQTHSLGVRYPLLSKVAEVELAVSDALDAADCPWVTSEQLQAQAPEAWLALRFGLAPAVRLIVLHWDWNQLAALCDLGERLPALNCPQLNEQTTLLVARRGHTVYARSLPGDEARALRPLAEGLSFGEICDAISQGGNVMQPATLVKFLGIWLEGQVLRWVSSDLPEVK